MEKPVFTGKFTQQEPIPEAGIEAALAVLRHGRLHRYNTAAGEVSETEHLEREFARIGVRVNTVAPGIFLTPMMESMPEHIQDSLAAQVPFPSRLGRPEEFADLVAYLYSNVMLNAETIRQDGAIRMQPK